MTTTPSPTPAQGIRLLYVGAAATVCMVGVYLLHDLIAPVFLAITLVLTVRPLVRWLNDRRMPKFLSGLIGMLTVYLVLILIMLAVTFALMQFVQAMPEFADEMRNLYTQLSSWLTSLGVSQDAITEFLRTFDFTRLVGLATGLFGQISGTASFTFTLFLFVAFIAVDMMDTKERRDKLLAVRPNLTASLVDFSWRVRRYWIVNTIFGLAVALINMGILTWLQIPLVLTWGILSFVTAYIPNIGFIIGMVPPALIALLSRGWQTMALMVGAYLVVNFIASMIIQPKVTGDAVGLNISTTFASLVFWSVIIGPVGAILAVPLTLFFKCILFDTEPRTRWLSVFLGGSLDDTGPGNTVAPLQSPPVQDDPKLDPAPAEHADHPEAQQDSDAVQDSDGPEEQPKPTS